MRGLLVVGLSHKTAPLEVRERLAVPAGDLETVVAELRGLPEVGEVMLVATCNRVEAYLGARDPAVASRSVQGHLEDRAGIALGQFLYERKGLEAVRHLFRVASSLDSMVVGEPQILGQVKDAYAVSERLGAVGATLGRCVPRAFGLARRIRRETSIAYGAVSVSSIAVDLASKVLGELKGRKVLLVGAGKMGETSARQLTRRGGTLTVVNRSYERAEELARGCGGEARSFGDLEHHLALADIVISSTASPRFVITHELMSRVVRTRRHRPLFMIDIAVPRDIDPRVNDLDNVFLFDIDDLQKVVDQNLEDRRAQAADALRMVDEELSTFDAHLRSLELVPTIVSMRERFQEIAARELERTLPRLKNLSTEEREALQTMTSALVAKLLHRPIAELKGAADRPEGAELIAAVQRLFELGPVAGWTADAVPEPATEEALADAEDAKEPSDERAQGARRA